jgi:CheY-like chemotaxis protein/HAMP domain-containing protein
MNLFRDLGLGSKLLLAFFTLLVVAAVPLSLSIWDLKEFDKRLEFIVSDGVEAVKQSARLHRNLFELRTQEKEAILAVSQDERQVALGRITRVRNEIEERYRALTTMNLDTEAVELARVYYVAYREYDQVLDRILGLGASNKGDEAHELSTSVGREMGDAVAKAAVRFTERQDRALDQQRLDASESLVRMLGILALMSIFAVVLGGVLSMVTSRNVVGAVGRILTATESIARGDLDTSIDTRGRDEIGQLAAGVSRMQDALRAARKVATDQDWLKTGVARVNEVVLGQDDVDVLATSVVTEVAGYLDAKVGALYFMGEREGAPELSLLGTYAYTFRKNLSTRFRLGEGLVGQAAREKKQILLQNAPEDYVRVVSGLGETVPRNLSVTPFVFEGSVRGVLEIGTMTALGELELAYLEQAMAAVATAFEIARAQSLVRTQQEELRSSNEELQAQARALERSQDELRAQQGELEISNVELETQMVRVKESEERLRVQQEELEVTNDELKNKNRLLERQKVDMEEARGDLAVKAEELALASKYKSEFLANMSHELRTPLNSLLLLARSLRDNAEGTLTVDQVESARVIFESGGDLLNLINEILDLSKVEAGRMEVRLESVLVADLSRTIQSQFDHMAQNQGLSFRVEGAPGAPDQVTTDPQRLGQVLKNLIGNALKFTEVGGVTVTFATVPAGLDLSRSGLDTRQAWAVHVADTGIGIPLDKQKVIFEAFQQADSGDRRRFGGTGLGLSISRELARLLGGEIQLKSDPARGSTFSLYLPIDGQAGDKADAKAQGDAEAPVVASAQRTLKPTSVGRKSGTDVVAQPLARTPVPAAVVDDDRDSINGEEHVILVVEDDARFARILAGHVKRRGFKCLVALSGEEGLELARAFSPAGIVLDIHLPNMNGWAVLTALKQDVDTRHIPVHIVSSEDPSAEGLRIGAIGHASKPLQAEDIDRVLGRIEAASAEADKMVLVVEDDVVMRRETVRIIGNGNVKIQEVGTGREALDALRLRPYDLIVLDLGLPDMPGLELLKTLASEKITLPPVIIYTVRELTQDEEATLRHYADSIILKDVRSQERLIDEVALFLHRVVRELPEDKRKAIRRLHETDEPLRGRKVLIVEDDMRTMFAMARLLAEHGINPLKAENGQKALAILEGQPDVDLVLMDMMMPVMDGYEASRRIRDQQRFANLPIIALTAKAMKEDRQKCIDAGASDYLSKPVDPDRLVSLMRVWLSR